MSTSHYRLFLMVRVGVSLQKDKTKKLKIYYTTDTHGFVMPTDYQDESYKQMGLANIISDVKKDENTLLIDGGDTIQGSPFSSYINTNVTYDKHPIAEILNIAGYDVVTLGNHEFNYGTSTLRNYINSLDATVLCANVKGFDRVDEYKIFTTKNGIKVGITGAVTDYINIWEKPEHLIGIEISDPLQSLLRIDKIFDEKLVDIKICIYHGGFEVDLETFRPLSKTKENIAYEISCQCGFDVLLTGHQHMSISGIDIKGTHAVQCAHNAKEYAFVQCVLGDKLTITSSLLPTSSVSYKPIVDYCLKYEQKVNSWLNVKIGSFDAPLIPTNHLLEAVEGSPIANFINQVQLDFTGADISSTALPNSFKGFNKEVSTREIVSTYVYSNTLKVFKISGLQLRQYLERSAEYFDIDSKGDITVSDSFLKPKVQHYNYDYFSGIYYTIDIRKPKGSRIISLTANGKEIEVDDYFNLVMNNYRASGSGEYDFIRDFQLHKEYSEEVTDLIIDYIKKNKKITVDKNKYCNVIH